MKKYIIIICFVGLNLVSLGCHAQVVNETVVTFLLDATDQPLYNAIDSDFKQNLNTFFTNTGVGTIDYGQRLTVRMGGIAENDELSLVSQSIALTDKRMSRKEAERQRNPRPLLELINSELAHYKQLSETAMSSSPIIDITLKAFREMNSEAREILVICTDGLEYTDYGNFYRNIPTTEQTVNGLISKIDPILLNEAKDQIASTDPEVIVILKPNDKVKKTTELKLFYHVFLGRLGVSTIRFIDNLSNNPNI